MPSLDCCPLFMSGKGGLIQLSDVKKARNVGARDLFVLVMVIDSGPCPLFMSGQVLSLHLHWQSTPLSAFCTHRHNACSIPTVLPSGVHKTTYDDSVPKPSSETAKHA